MLPKLEAFVPPPATGPDHLLNWLCVRTRPSPPVFGSVGSLEESADALVQCIEEIIKMSTLPNLLIEFIRNGVLSDRDIMCPFWSQACKQSRYLQKTNEALYKRHLQTHCEFMEKAWQAKHSLIKYTVSIARTDFGSNRYCLEFHL